MTGKARSRPMLGTRLVTPIAVLLVLLLVVLSGSVEARVIHRERSLYSTILVDQQGSLVCLQFSMRYDQRNQSCMDTSAPRKLVFGYAKMMLASLLLNPEPARILIVGLGGGTLPVVLAELHPSAEIDVVEIDPAVQKVAETYFGFSETEHMRVVVQDARVFTKRARVEEKHYDLIMLDAFNGEYIPEHLMTREYLEETRDLLSPGGVLAANTFAISRLYDHESVTYSAVFGEFFNVTMPSSANRIVIASNAPLPNRGTLDAAARALAPRLRAYDMRMTDYPPLLRTTVDWDTSARELTDQYSPANLLRNQ